MSITIEIGNSYSQVKGMTPEVYRALRKALSYESDPQAAYFSGGHNRTKYLIDTKGYFPTGLLARAQDVLHGRGFKCVDKRTKPDWKFDEFDHQGAYQWQLEALAESVHRGRGIISASTGSGKSRVISLIARSSGLKTLVIVPSKEIKLQLRELLKDVKTIRIENIDSTALKTLKGFDCLIIDECHHVAAKTYQTLNKTVWKDIYYRFMLTATPFRNQANEQLLFEGIAGQVIYQLDYKEAVSNKYIVPVEAFYIDLPKTKVEGYTWSQVYSELVVNNEQRNLIIASTILNFNAAGVATLCLVKEVAHGNILSELTGLPFANGKDEESRDYIRQFNSGGIKTLIGTTGILGEGVDTKPAEYIIIAGLGKAKSAFMQQVGRGVRRHGSKDSAKIIIFKDRSHKWCLAHFNAQKRILLEEYGVISLLLD